MAEDIKISEFPKVSANAILDSSKKIATEIRRFSPSSVVSLFEIDLESVLIDRQAIYDTELRGDAVFRFHNNLKLLKQDIIWRGQVYRALPIKVDGYESNTRGTLPTPKMSITSSDATASFFSDFRSQIRRADDLIGAKVTRIRTFTKYLDEENFFVKVGNVKTPIGNLEHIVPEDFEPDALAEFPREIFYIERKSAENKNSLEFELSSAIDFENLRLPKRIVIASTCNFTYRGEGCLYEYVSHYSPTTSEANRKKAEKGLGCDDIRELNLPSKAPPVANANDELFQTMLGNDYRVNQDPTLWRFDLAYIRGDMVYLERAGTRRYYIANTTVPSSTSQPNSGPPNKNYWLADQCSKRIAGCKLRWSNSHKGSLGLQTIGSFSMGASRPPADPLGDGNTHKEALPFGGFPATNKLS